jgi:hypothetical protein
MQTLHATIEIDAPAKLVWGVVSDLPAYREWNPFIVSAAGDLRVGERLHVTIRAPGLRPVGFKPRILDYEPGRLLRWKGELLVPGLFDGRHALSVEALGDSRSRFTTHEDVGGLLTPFLKKTMRASQQGFEEMSRALAARVLQLRPGAAAGSGREP